MANVTIDFTSHADEVKEALNEAITAALEAIGMQAENYAKLNLYPGHGLDTGNLRNSISHAQESEDTEVIGTNVEYAAYVELGHHTASGGYVSPKPYLAPAVQDHVDEYKQIVKEYLQNG